MTMPTPLPVTIGISACLMGQNVRYDGSHKHDRYVTETLGRFFRIVPVCPEVECGLPVPREPMRLERHAEGVRLVAIETRADHTGRMLAWCAKRVVELEQENLCGFIFKKNSPSSGLYDVTIYHDGIAEEMGRGLFAGAVTEHFPHLPVEEAERLHDRELMKNFIERVLAYRRWKDTSPANTL